MSNISIQEENFVTEYSQKNPKFRHISKILLRRRFIVLGVSFVVISITGLLALMTEPTYKSYMEILVSSQPNQGTDENSLENSSDNKTGDSARKFIDYYTAQKNLMLSSKLIEQAVVSLRAEYPNITVEDIKGKRNDSQNAPLKVTQLDQKNATNQLVSPVFEISFINHDPVKAYKVLLALQKVYIDYNIEQKQERLNKGLALINERLPGIKKQLQQSESKLENFLKKHNSLNPQLESQVLVKSLGNIQNEIQTTRAQLQDVQTRYKNLEKKIAASSQSAVNASRLRESTRYQILLSEIQKTEQALAKEQLRYTDNSPIIVSLKQQRENQLELLQQEVKQLSANAQEEAALTREQLVGVQPQLAEELIQLQTTALGLTAKEKSLVESEQRIRADLKKYPSLIAEYQRLLPEVETHRKALEQMLQAQNSLGWKITQGGWNWEIVEAPTLGSDNGNYRLLLMAGGIVIGPILGIAIALIWGMRHRVIHSAQDLQRVTHLRLLGSIPKLAANAMEKRLPSLALNWRRKAAPSLVENSSWLPCHETLDMVYQNTQILKYPFPFNSLMVTSAIAGEGKTTLALGLAASAAHMHQRVLLIDANLRSPKLHKILQLSNEWGLSLLLVDETDTNIQDYIQPIHPSIDILTGGPIPEDPIKLLSSPRLKELIDIFEQNYDLVLIDAPPILGNVDSRIIASLCNGIMMVGRIGWVTQNEVTQAVEILNQLNLIGIIANEVSH
ncbi:exopolysaccharide transport family protein [Anabaena sp. 4-3]|uniref:GumC family protein n=1 Tax=Anabaena sp. 4-3 TaxID=1811979 RepID=UPI00083237A9|nr:exopolysaccharide transport family protein [Anabaena sp. 4-3]